MFARCVIGRENQTFASLGRLPARGKPLFHQQQSDHQKIMTGRSLRQAAKPTSAAVNPNKTPASQLPWLEEPAPLRKLAPTRAAAPLPYADPTEVDTLVSVSPDGSTVTYEEEDIVMDLPATLLGSTAAKGVEELRAFTGKGEAPGADRTPEQDVHQHPAARGVGKDVIDMVTDAFREERETQIKKRRQVLYEITHPNPLHYRYRGKLVPPPPLSFGEVTGEAQQLGEEMMLGQTYSLVNRAGTRRTDTVEDSPTQPTMIEVGEGRTRQEKWSKYRSRKREDNIFRDHNYFFEINELYQEIVFVGRACAGKSSLLNALLGQPNLAKTSSTPNTTRAINFYQSVSPEALQQFHEKERHNLVKLPGKGLQLTFVDVPGFGIEGMSDKWRDAAIELTDAYFGVRRSVNTVLFCIDCERGLTPTDMRYFKWLENVQGVFYIVLTKCDSVSHTRLCSVMRSIYSLITRNRKKYRKVFPFIIPTSAHTGDNMDLLRGLIMETSGMIPADKLRQLLQQKQDVLNKDALQKEAARLEAVRQLEREEARRLFLEARQPLLAEATKTEEEKEEGGNDVEGAPPKPVSYRLPLYEKEDTSFSAFLQQYRRAHPDESPSQCRLKAYRQWRAIHPLPRQVSSYGDFQYKLNTGLERPEDEELTLTTTAPQEVHSEEEAPPAPPAGYTSSRVMGVDGETVRRAEAAKDGTSGGAVSGFVDTLKQFGAQSKKSKTHLRGKKANAAFVAQDADGRLYPYQGGKKAGPALTTVNTELDKRHAEWKMTQLGEMLIKENPEAPWLALKQIRQKVNARKEDNIMKRNMSKKDVQSYLKYAGSITDSFEKFESEVTTAKFMTESRTTKTLRSREQMHYNATGKINYRSMPVGLWKHYGERETYWPTPRVKGKMNDESHTKR
ncbi:50S ribosome-binding GTPase, putative [Angomonas deanei]|uniref:50S ribosome-binding GTPase, putative n=1 Tax=Angomonas deanei TaxID=59799 RepID=A0A7G2CGA0_9TRYP|nr:50S ribosome-binding GTPase, putative [Angomonas deanei]